MQRKIEQNLKGESENNPKSKIKIKIKKVKAIINK